MAVDFTKIITPKVIASNLSRRNSVQDNYIHPVFFPHMAKASIDLVWLKGSKGKPVSLMPSAYDAKATFRDRIPVKVTKTEMPFFREGFHISEKDKMNFERAVDANDPYVIETLNFIFDDSMNLVEGARVVPEREVMQLLFPENGDIGISVIANGTNYTYNYDTDGSWKENNYFELTGNDKWDAPATADPVATLETVRDAIDNSILNLAIMNKATYLKMASTAAVLARANRGLANATYATQPEVLNVIKAYNETDIIVYDGKFTDEDGNVRKFIPDGYVAYLPNDGVALGNTWYARTPEMVDAESFNGGEVAVVDEGISIITYTDEHPVTTNIIASEIVLPSFERIDDFACIKVF